MVSNPEDVTLDELGPREPPAQAWRRAVLTLTFLVELGIAAAMVGVAEFCLPQHTRPVPVQRINGTWARAFLLDNAYGSDTVSNLALMLLATLGPLAVAIRDTVFRTNDATVIHTNDSTVVHTDGTTLTAAAPPPHLSAAGGLLKPKNNLQRLLGKTTRTDC